VEPRPQKPKGRSAKFANQPFCFSAVDVGYIDRGNLVSGLTARPSPSGLRGNRQSGPSSPR
jgi:hypothetical protein